MVEFFIAVRHILERKFQSIFSILGVAIAVTYDNFVADIESSYTDKEY